MSDYRWWELDSPFQSSHKTQKHALEVSAVSSKKESLSAEIDEYGYGNFVLWCAGSSLSTYCPTLYTNQHAVLLRSFKNPEETYGQEEV